jgi:hypothetical protein
MARHVGEASATRGDRDRGGRLQRAVPGWAAGPPSCRSWFSGSAIWKGILIAVPAVVGVTAGTAIQQRISERAVAAAFVVLPVTSAAVLIF